MLELRKAEIKDFEFYYKLKCEKSSVYWGGYDRIPDHEKLKKFWKETIGNEKGKRHIYILFNGVEPVGYVQTICEKGDDIGLSMGIVENARGKGYGSDILRMTIEINDKAKSFYSYIREDNIASKKSFEHNGFIQTGESYEQFFSQDNKSFRMLKYIKNKVLAIIPARSGSKGLKDKNIKILNGKPLIAYSIDAAILSGIFDTVHVSTDSKEYSKIASEYGADEAFLRDPRNSGDVSLSWDTVREVIRKYKELNKEYKTCILLQPTSPLRNADDIKKAYEQFIRCDAKSLTSVTEVEHPVQWCFKLDDNHSMTDFSRSPFKNSRRQELDKYYRENGAIYIANITDILDKYFDFYTEKCVAYVMDRNRSIDIDSLQDFVIAEILIKMGIA